MSNRAVTALCFTLVLALAAIALVLAVKSPITVNVPLPKIQPASL